MHALLSTQQLKGVSHRCFEHTLGGLFSKKMRPTIKLLVRAIETTKVFAQRLAAFHRELA
jgi:hypothetical protein